MNSFPRYPKIRKKCSVKKVWFTAFAMLLIITAFYVNWLLTPQITEGKIILIQKGISIKDISKLASEGKLIKELALQTSLYAAARFKHKYVMSGEYELTPGMSGIEMLGKLIKGNRMVRKITIPEGYTNFQIMNLLNSASYLHGEIHNKYSEGSLLPNTYYYYYGDSKQSILDRMKTQMDDFISANNVHDHKKVLILASIVEKEAKCDDERKIIASVYLNRINIGMPLQADPTVIYGLFDGNTDFRHNLTKTELSYVSPYNTYINRGLPPTPIANPGKASILAVLAPATTPWLYFVSDGEGGHRFASNLRDHNKNVQLWIKTRNQPSYTQSSLN